jgi:glucosylceramidase
VTGRPVAQGSGLATADRATIGWTTSTEGARWQDAGHPTPGATADRGLTLTEERGRPIRGFGGCFNELGYRAITALSETDQELVFRELFHPDELNLRVNRSAIGANDFAASWYSYDEVPGDYALEHFSVERDERAVLPFIRQAQRYQDDMVLHCSPWSPPTWMKDPPAYNYGRIVMTPENLDAYARYFVRFVQEYAARGVRVDQIHVQNEVFADQKFPSCLWSSEQLRVFIRDHLGPAVEAAGLDVGIYLGTLNGPEDAAFTATGQTLTNYARFVDNILFDDEARRHLTGVGYQWAGQHAVARTRKAWPELDLVQTESECGFGDNAWEDAEYVFHLVRHYLEHDVSGYTYWNMALEPGGLSTWGWPQNSLFTVDTGARTFTRNPEYYVIKHYSSAVRPGAVRVGTTGRYSAQGSAYENADGSLAVVVQNALDREQPFSLTDPAAGARSFTAMLAPRSLNTFLVPA